MATLALRLLVLAAALCLALAAATSAAANAPEVQAFHMDFNYVDTSPCGFPVAVDGWLDVTTTTFVDADGAPTRSATRNRAEFTWVGPTGLVAWNDHAWNSSVDPLAATQTITGVLTRVVGPSVGESHPRHRRLRQVERADRAVGDEQVCDPR